MASFSVTGENEAHRASFNTLLGAIEQSRRELYAILSSQLP
jgi:hypothetical protein